MRSGHSWLWLSVPSKGPYSGLWVIHKEHLRSIHSKRGESTKLWSFTSWWDPASWEPCHKALVNIQGNTSHLGTRKWNPAIKKILHPIRTLSIGSWAKTWFAYSFGTRKWNPARSHLSKFCSQSELFQPGHQLRPHLHIQLSQSSWILHTSAAWDLFRNTMPVILVKIII